MAVIILATLLAVALKPTDTAPLVRADFIFQKPKGSIYMFKMFDHWFNVTLSICVSQVKNLPAPGQCFGLSSQHKNITQ